MNVEAAFVILLERDARRVENVRRGLADTPLKAEIFPAVDAADLSPHELGRLERCGYLAPGLDAKLLSGQIACSLSHVFLLERIVTRHRGKVLVLEDDFVLENDFAARLSVSLGRAPEPYDLLYLFTYEPGRSAAMPGVSGIRRPTRPAGTVAYVVTPEGAARILELAKPIRDVIDDVLAKEIAAGRLRALAVEPPLVRHRAELGSSIDGTSRIAGRM